MNSNLLMKCMWYANILPSALAGELGITQRELYKKIYITEQFTKEEIRKIEEILQLAKLEVELIFGGKGD